MIGHIRHTRVRHRYLRRDHHLRPKTRRRLPEHRHFQLVEGPRARRKCHATRRSQAYKSYRGSNPRWRCSRHR